MRTITILFITMLLISSCSKKDDPELQLIPGQATFMPYRVKLTVYPAYTNDNNPAVLIVTDDGDTEEYWEWDKKNYDPKEFTVKKGCGIIILCWEFTWEIKRSRLF